MLSTANIQLKLQYTNHSEGGDLVNIAQASGGYDGLWITATNISVLSNVWLNCCPPQILASKNATIDSNDKTKRPEKSNWLNILFP